MKTWLAKIVWVGLALQSFHGGALAAPSVSLVGSKVFSLVGVNPGVTDQTNTVSNIDLDDRASLLVLAVPGETVNVTDASFGGTAMTLTKAFAQSYAKVRFFTLFEPSLADDQALTIVADNPYSSVYGGYSPQIYVFSNVEAIGDTPEVGSGGADTVTLDFGSVTNRSYLLMVAAGNGSASLSFQAPATPLTETIAGNPGGWEVLAAGEAVSADGFSKTVEVTSSQRVAVIGLELLPPPPPPAGMVFSVR